MYNLNSLFEKKVKLLIRFEWFDTIIVLLQYCMTLIKHTINPLYSVQ